MNKKQVIEFFKNATEEQIREIAAQKDWQKFLGIKIKNLFFEFDNETGLEIAESITINNYMVEYVSLLEREF